MAETQILAIDTETTYTDDYNKRHIVGLAVATDKEEFYIPLGHSENIFGGQNFDGLFPVDLFKDYTGTVVMHNAKFDLHVLYRAGIFVPTDNLYDTMLMHHYIDENPPHGLKDLAKLILGEEESKDLAQKVKKAGSHFGYEGVPAFLMGPYAEQDVRWTRDLFYEFWEDFEEYRECWEIDKQFMLLLLQMERTGLSVDRELGRSLQADANTRLRQIELELGFDPKKPTQLARKLFAIPPEGLGLKPASYGSSGRPTMDSDYLESVGHPVTALVCEYRTIQKALSSYYTPYLSLSAETGRIHPTFKQHGTLTGRLSCENPNLQQIPRDSAIKRMFLADADSELWEFDFRNIEMRLAAVYSGEESLLSTFREEGDVHGMVAKELGIGRHEAKTVNFLILYGGGVKKLNESLKCGFKRAETILNEYWANYPGLRKTISDANAVAEKYGWVQMWSGRKRHFKYSSEYHKAFNAVVQGGAFEIVKRSMLYLADDGWDLRNQVHDSVWVNIPKEKVKYGLDRIPEVMAGWTEPAFGLRFSVDAKRLN